MNYEYYEVQNCENFEELLYTIKSKYSANVAFKTRDNEYTYNDLYNDICICRRKLCSECRKYFVLDITDDYLFTVFYFSVVLSNNIAILTNKEDFLDSNLSIDYIYIDRDRASDILSDNMLNNKININNINKDDDGVTRSYAEVCTLVCSSGTTSKKKWVMLSQKNIISDMIGGMMCYEYKENSVYLNVIPYTHMFGIVADLLGPLYSGSCICYGEQLKFFDNLRFFKPTNLNLPPILVKGLYKVLVDSNSFTYATGGRLKKIMCAGAKMDDSLNELFSKYGLRVYSAYGLTECSPCVSLSRDNFYKNNSAGMVLPCCKVQIIENEIVVSGTNVMLGYFMDEKSTKEVIKNEKLYTGDIGYLDSDNFLYITGRKSNMIVFSDGNKLMPEELEEYINDFPFVSECKVYGVDDKFSIDIFPLGELNDVNYETLINLIKEKNMFAKLKNINVLSLPIKRNNLGKIIRS